MRKLGFVTDTATNPSSILISAYTPVRGVIWAGSGVTKDVPANAVVVGNPARVVRAVGPDEHPAHPHQYSAQSIAEAQAFYDSLTSSSD